MSRGPPHRYNSIGERFRGYPPRHGEFSGSSGYGYYGGPPYKRQRHLSSDDEIGPPQLVTYGPAFYDPPYARHQEVGLGEFNDFSSVSVDKDLKIHEKDGSRRDHERSESYSKKRQSSTEGSGHSSQQQSSSVPVSPHQQSPRARPISPPSSSNSASTQPLLIVTSQPTSSSKGPPLSSSDDGILVSKQLPLLAVCPTVSQSVPGYGPVLGDRLKDGTGRLTFIPSLSPHDGPQRKESYPGPAVEAISPSAPASGSCLDKDGENEKEVKVEPSDMMSKDELLQGMEKVDREIAQVNQQINNLKKMQKQLEDEASKQPDEPTKEEVPAPEVKPKSVVQIIYEENRKKAEAAQARVAKLGVPLPGRKPLYNQPSDLPCYHENLTKAPGLKAKLVKYFQLRKQAKEIKNRQLCKGYKTLKQAWLKKIERHENNPKRKQKEAKLREFYEKVFPEIKKQREQTERFTRMGSRSNWGIVARSEAEFNEIVDNLNEQEANERHMRTLAVEPPPMLDKEERRLKFINRNGLIRDPLATLNERKHRNIWTEKERQIFKDKFIHNPKDFDLISSFLPGKSVADCILFYYQTKKKEHYKQLSRRHNLKKRRRDQFAAGREGAPPNKTRAGVSESSAKGDRGGSEGDEDLEEITDSAEESEENEENPPPPVSTPQVATPTPPAKRPDHVESSRWSEKEIEIALQGLRECGRDWEAIARRVVTKTGAQCKNFYFNYKKKMHLEDLIAEHEKTKIHRAQQQQRQQRHHQQQQQPQQKDISSAVDKHEPMPKLAPGAQQSDTPHPNQNNPKSNAVTSNIPITNARDSTSRTTANPVVSPANIPTISTTSSVSSLQQGGSRIARSQSPRLPLTSSSSTLFMPTPGVIASIGRASPNVGTTQQGQGYFQPLLIESMKQDTPHSSRTLHPESIQTGFVYPRAVDPSHLKHGLSVSSHSDSRSLFEGAAVLKQLPHSTSSHHSSSNIVLSTEEVPRPVALTSNPGSSHVTTLHLGSSHAIISHPGSSQPAITPPGISHTLTSHPGISHTGRPHSENSFGHTSGAEPSPVSSILFTPSGPAHSHRGRHSPVIVAPQDKPQNQVTFLKEGSVGHPSSHKPPYVSSFPGNIRGESVGRIIMKTEDVRRDISPEMHKKPVVVPEPDVIVIDVDDQKKRVEGYPRLETAEGNQASSMLRRLASAGNASSVDHVVPATEPVRPQSLPLSSDTRLMSHTESRTQRSATPPSSSLAARQPVPNPPPPLIQMSSSRDKKYITTQDMAPESSRPREGSVHGDPNQDHYLHYSQETTCGGDAPRHTHTPVDNRGGEKERRTLVVETVDLTKEREVGTSPLTRPSSRSHIALGSSSARATLQAMAMCASSDNKSADATEKIAQSKREETHLPPRAPDTKLSAYEQNEAIRKFNALGNVCVSVPREFATGGDYPTQPYSLMALQAQHQPHVHPHPTGTSTPPPYGYPFHIPYQMASFHHHPDRPFFVPVVHHLPPHSVNGEELPSHVKLSGTYAHQYPQGVSYFPAGVRSVLPTYQPMTVCGHRHPVSLGEERRAMPHPLEVPARRENDISEQDLAHPFLVRQSRHVHASGLSERVSPGELPNISRSSRSPHEPVQRPHAISPETKSRHMHAPGLSEQVSPGELPNISRPSRSPLESVQRPHTILPETKSRHMHAPGLSERVSPDELPNISRPSRSPHEPVQRPHTISPETKPHVQHVEAAKAVSPPAATYLSRIPSRPASVSEMRNRAAVIPELKDTEAMSQKFPEPQPVIVSASKHSSREDVDRLTEQSSKRDTKEPPREDPMSAFDTLVDVAAAARKVDIPFYAQEEYERPAFTGEATVKREKPGSQETRGPHARITGRGMTSPPRLSSPPNPTSISPGMPDAPRYGITTGLVPKPPPLMPITGMRSMQEGGSSSSIPLSVSVGGHATTSVSRSANKMLSPPGTKVKVAVSPDGPPPLISTSVISPTESSQGASPNRPPPLIRGIVSPGPPPLRSPEKEADSTVKTRSNHDTLAKRRPDQEPSISKGALHEDESVSHIDPDFQRKFWVNLNESVPLYFEKADRDAKNTSSPCKPGHSQVKTIVVTRAHLDSARDEVSHPARQSFQPSAVVRPEQYQPLPSSSSAVSLERKEATIVREVPRSWLSEKNNRNMPKRTLPEQSPNDHDRNEEGDEGSQESWRVNKKAFSFEQEPVVSYSDTTASSPQRKAPLKAATSCASGSETEEGEGELETETPTHLSSVGLHPRVLALARNSQRNTQSYYDASDSETLSAEESEHLPESSDEMFASTTTKVYTQADDLHEESRDNEQEDILKNNSTLADTCDANTNAPLPSTSKDYSDSEDEHTEGSLEQEGAQKSNAVQNSATSIRPVSPPLPVSISDQITEELPTTSTFPGESHQEGGKPQVYPKTEGETDVTFDQQNSEEAVEASDQELTPSQTTSPNEPSPEEDSSEALPASVDEGVEQMDMDRVQSSEDNVVGSSETDIASTHPQVLSSHQQVSEDIPDSSANTVVTRDESITSVPKENIQDRDTNLTDIVTSIDIDDKVTTADQSLMEEQSVLDTVATDADACPSTSGTTNNTVSPQVGHSEDDEAINEAEALENASSGDGFLNASDTFSPLSDNHPPEVSSAMDDVSDDEDHSTYPTFVREFAPLPGEVDSPDIRSECSTNITSEASSITDDHNSERELKGAFEPTPSYREEPSGVLSPDERARHSDDTLSEGEIPPSQKSSQSEDELVSVEEKSASNEAEVFFTSEPCEKSQPNWLPDTSQAVIDRDQLPSQSRETVDDEQLSEGEIPESEEEATVETSQGSPSSDGDADSVSLSSRRASVVSSSQEATLSTDCYINMIPISPAPPESPSHQSKSDHTALLPQWPSVDSQYSSSMSLPLTSRMTPFPYSTLSFNVGSANSSARSSPVPQALAVSLASGSSPSSSSLLPRPQEPTPLLSDNYEPLSDDDYNGVADTSRIAEDTL